MVNQKVFNTVALKKLEDVNIIGSLILSTCFSVLTGISSLIKIYLPFTPVPVTAQILVVLGSGLILGPYFGSLSQFIYMILGLSGVPWFAAGNFGITAGYILGFIIASYIAGYIYHNYNRLLLSVIAGILTVYIMGALYFSIFTNTNIFITFKLSILPFIPFDLLKGAILILVFSKINR